MQGATPAAAIFKMSTDQDIVDHTHVLVTGSSKGIGLEFLRQLLTRPGTKLFAAVRSPANAFQLQELQRQHESRLVVLEMDVSSEQSIKAAAEQFATLGGCLDILINNAAVGMPEAFLEMDQEGFMEVLKVNTVGPYLVIKHFLPFLRAGKKKLIANVSSRPGSVQVLMEPLPPGPGTEMVKKGLAYRVSKCALNYETAYFAKHLDPEGFIVVALHPGYVVTDLASEGAKLGGYPPPTMMPADSVAGLLAVLDGLVAKDTAKFYDYKGIVIPW